MTIRHLRIFVTVVDCGKMRQAAELLYISQPSVSQAIQELENYYSVKLFERLAQKLYLTESGQKLLPYARHLIDSFDTMNVMMKNEGFSKTLRIGGSVSVGTYLLNDLIDELEKVDSDIELQIEVNNTSTIENMIKDSRLDVGIVEGVVTSQELIKIPICKDELVIIVGKAHHLYHKESVELSELQEEVWVSREKGSMSRNQYEQLLIERNYRMNHQWCCTSTETIKQAVIRGRGIAIISMMVIERELLDGVLRILPVKDVKVARDIQLIYHKNKFISQPLQHFIEICKKAQ